MMYARHKTSHDASWLHDHTIRLPTATPPVQVLQHVFQREHGHYFPKPKQVVAEYVSLQLPGLLSEKQFEMGKINKIFAAQWLSDKQVVFGTKCNKLMVVDTGTKKMVNIPSLKSGSDTFPAHCPCGIHSIAINPSRSLLATGGDNTNDLAIYRLPTFDPVCVGEKGHADWIFDIKWLDDEFVVTGSRDSHVCLWKVQDQEETQEADSESQAIRVPEYFSIKPTAKRPCSKAEKVRAIAFNDQTGELAALSLNAYIHLFDMKTLQQKTSRHLAYIRENVCMCIDKGQQLYAIGSQSHVTFLDPRTCKQTGSIQSIQRGCGIRSVSINENIVTIGTGVGSVYFYDIRARNFLSLYCGHTCALQVGKGWLRRDDTYRDFFMDQEYPNAIYTHCYDESGTRLFAAGGPLPAGLWGNYAGLWQ